MTSMISEPYPQHIKSESKPQQLKPNELAAVEKHVPRMVLKTMLDAGASSFGKAFVLYALPMSVLRRELKKAILKRASAIAAFMGVAKAVQLFLFQQKNENLRYYSQAIAGGIGASIALAIDSGIGTNTLVIWIAIRALRCLLEENYFGQLVNNIPFLPTITMCASAGQILSSWVRYPSDVDPGYKRFLDSQGGRPTWVMERLKHPNHAIPYPLKMIRKPGCGYISDTVQYFICGLKRAGKIYVPLYVASLIFGLLQVRNHTSSRLGKLLLNFVSNVSRSTLFLTTYCTIAWASAILVPYIWRNNNRGATRVGLRRQTVFAGLATLLERKERRPELAAYCATYALDSLWTRFAVKSTLMQKCRPYIAGLLLILSCSVLLHHHNKQPALVTKWVLGFETEEEKGAKLAKKLE